MFFSAHQSIVKLFIAVALQRNCCDYNHIHGCNILSIIRYFASYYDYTAQSYIELIDMITFLMQIHSCNSQLCLLLHEWVSVKCVCNRLRTNSHVQYTWNFIEHRLVVNLRKTGCTISCWSVEFYLLTLILHCMFGRILPNYILGCFGCKNRFCCCKRILILALIFYVKVMFFVEALM